MRSAVKTHLSLAQRLKYKSAIFSLLETAFKIHLPQKSEGARAPKPLVKIISSKLKVSNSVPGGFRCNTN